MDENRAYASENVDFTFIDKRENSEKQSSSIAMSGILTGSDFAPIPWFPVPEFPALRVHILLKYFEKFLSKTHLFFLAWIVLILKMNRA